MDGMTGREVRRVEGLGVYGNGGVEMQRRARTVELGWDAGALALRSSLRAILLSSARFGASNRSDHSEAGLPNRILHSYPAPKLLPHLKNKKYPIMP